MSVDLLKLHVSSSQLIFSFCGQRVPVFLCRWFPALESCHDSCHLYSISSRVYQVMVVEADMLTCTCSDINIGNYVEMVLCSYMFCFVELFVSECGSCCDSSDQREYCSQNHISLQLKTSCLFVIFYFYLNFPGLDYLSLLCCRKVKSKNYRSIKLQNYM